MSTILKALRRLEREKAAAAGRPAPEELLVADVRGGGRGRSLFVLACGVAAVAGLLLLLWARPRGFLPSLGGQQDGSERLSEAPRRAAASGENPLPEAASLVPGSMAERAFSASQPEARLKEAPPSQPEARVAPVVRPMPAPAAPAAAPARPRVVSPAVEPMPRPDLVVARTLWHPDPEKRVAIVELAGRETPLRLREGDAVGPLVVREIEPSGVLFVQGDVEVLQRVGGLP